MFVVDVAVRLWIGNGDNFMPALQWEVSLKSLICIGDFVSQMKACYQLTVCCVYSVKLLFTFILWLHESFLREYLITIVFMPTVK